MIRAAAQAWDCKYPTKRWMPYLCGQRKGTIDFIYQNAKQSIMMGKKKKKLRKQEEKEELGQAISGVSSFKIGEPATVPPPPEAEKLNGKR